MQNNIAEIIIISLVSGFVIGFTIEMIFSLLIK